VAGKYPWGIQMKAEERTKWLKAHKLFGKFQDIRNSALMTMTKVAGDKFACDEIWKIYKESLPAEPKKKVAKKATKKAPAKKDNKFKLTVEHCAWVIAHYDPEENAAVTRDDAPTIIAWNILLQAREDNKTFQAILERVAPPKNTTVEKVNDEENLNLTGLANSVREEFGSLLQEAEPILRRVAPSIF